MNSLGRLHSLTKNLIRSNKFGEYVKIIQEQINEGIFERKPVEMKKIIGWGVLPIMKYCRKIFISNRLKG